MKSPKDSISDNLRILEKYEAALRKMVHKPNCNRNHVCCPENCCKYSRKFLIFKTKRLNLYTSCLWEVADRIEYFVLNMKVHLKRDFIDPLHRDNMNFEIEWLIKFVKSIWYILDRHNYHTTDVKDIFRDIRYITRRIKTIIKSNYGPGPFSW